MKKLPLVLQNKIRQDKKKETFKATIWPPKMENDYLVASDFFSIFLIIYTDHEVINAVAKT